jgi:hypothetical protein
VDAAGNEINPTDSTFTYDLTAGTITISGAPNWTGHAQPFKLIHRIEDEMVIADLDISGQVSFNRPVTHVFPANDAYLSSALEMGNLQARSTDFFTQATWTNVWSNVLIGDEPLLQFDSQNYDIAVYNDGAIQERWVLIFTSNDHYKCIGENIGQIATAQSINADFAPSNPVSGVPYFIIPSGAFGLGGSVGNVFRFNTIAANYPVWVGVTVLPSAGGEIVNDTLELYIRGNGD